MTALLVLTLQKQHPCQKDEDDFDDPEPADEESAEFDWLVVECAMDVIAGLSSALGEQFGELFKIFESPMMKYASGQERFERATAVGSMADCIQGMGAASGPYTKKLMNIFLKRLSDEDPETKSNACFGTGLLCEKSTDQKTILSNYGTIFGKLEPLLEATPEGSDDPHVRLLDNAAGCVARMVKAYPQNVPLEEVLPRLVDILPLKQDYDENVPVFEMIISLYQQQNSTIQGLTNKLIPIFEQVLGPPEEQLSDDLKGKVTQLVDYLRG